MAEGESKLEWGGVVPEPIHAIDKVKSGEFCVAYFGGQTHLFIPKEIFLKLSKKVDILELVASIYDVTTISRFSPSTFMYANSFLIDLPSQSGWEGRQYQPLGKVNELIDAIKIMTA